MSSAALRDGILTVPVIDITSFRMPYADAAARSEVVRQVDAAARTVGFMQVTGHGIPVDHAQRVHQRDRRVLRPRRAAPRPGTAARRASTAATPRRRRSPWPTASAWPAPRTCSRRSTWAPSAADFPGLDLPEDVYAANVYPADEVPGFEAAVTAWFEAAGRVAADDGADLRRGPRRPRGLLRAVHRPLDRRAADEQLPAARPRRRGWRKTSSAWARTPTTAS